jgi:hypothetical protein
VRRFIFFKSCQQTLPSARPHVLRPCVRQPRGCHFNWLWPFVMLRATPQLFSAQPRLCSGFVMIEGFSSLASPGHARMHIGACLPDSNRRAALVRLLLEGFSSLDVAPAAMGHGLALTAAEFRVLVFVSLVELHPCQKAASHLPCTRPPDRMLLADPSDLRVWVAVNAPPELSSPLAPAQTPWPAVARTTTTKSRRKTTLLALQHSAVLSSVAHDRSHRLLCLMISAQILPCPPHLVPGCLKSPHCTLFLPHTRSRSKTPGTFCSCVTVFLRSSSPPTCGL